MTSPSDRIQSLVDQINTILHDASVDGEPMTDEYQVLEQTRQRLVQLQGPSLPPMVSASMETNEAAIAVQDWSAPAPVLAESAQQVLQAIVQEMAYLRMNTVQPLREEITRLQQERNYLASEVQQLQHQRYQLVLAQQTDQQQMINGFLHALMERLQEQLTLQVAQTIAQLEGRSSTTLVSTGDAKVMQLDSTLQVVFDSLQTNINTHQAALEDSLRKMQGLGQQGEAMFTAFVNRLASRLGQEASQYLHTPASDPSLDSPVRPGATITTADSPFSPETGDLNIAAGLPLQTETIIPDRPGNSLTQPIAEMQPEAEIEAEPSAILTTDEMGGPSLADEQLDQVIDALENEAIAPLDALEVVDNLDLGLGLDAVQLADVPTDQTELAALLQETDEPASFPEQPELQLYDPAPQNDAPPSFPNEADGTDAADMSPLVLAPPEGLTAPLQPIATLQLDQDDVDVDRLLNVINASANDDFEGPLVQEEETAVLLGDNPETVAQSTPELDVDTGTEDEIIAEITADSTATDVAAELEPASTTPDPDDVDLLRQELATELQDEMLDEQLFDTSSGLQLPENILPASEPLPTAPQQESSISFTIKNSSPDAELWGNEGEHNEGEEKEANPDFYGAFVDDSDTSGPSEAEFQPEIEELWTEDDPLRPSSEETAAAQETASLDPDILELTTIGDEVESSTPSTPDLGIPEDDAAFDLFETEDTDPSVSPSSEEPFLLGMNDSVMDNSAMDNSAIRNNAGDNAMDSSTMDDSTMDDSTMDDGTMDDSTMDDSTMDDSTTDSTPSSSDDGISDSWSQWLDNAATTTLTMPEMDEPEDPSLSDLLEPEPDAPTVEPPSAEDTIHQLTDLAQQLSSESTPELDTGSTENDLSSMFADDSFGDEPESSFDSSAETESNLWLDQGGEPSPTSDLTSEAPLADDAWLEQSTDFFTDAPS
ncbi:MAG: hypothetical protein F6K30_15765, partial [Cyanothece sp. SIO2G6]|nr:hypothetical protein [Cyanothece sp. SIO2G6]